MFFVLLVALYTSRVVLAALGIVDYGIYNVVGSVVAMFTFISQALGNATNRFIVFSLGEGDRLKTKQVFNTCVAIHIGIAIFVAVLLETVGMWFLNNKLNIPIGREFAALWAFHLSVATCVLVIIKTPFSAEIIAHEQMGVYAYISIFNAIVKLVIVYLLSVSNMDKLVCYVFLLMLVQILDCLLHYIVCRRKFKECRLSLSASRNKKMYQDIGIFAGWSLLGNIVWLGYTQGLNLMLNIFFGPVVNAARGVAVQVQTAVMSFISSFQTAINPQIIKSYAQHNYDRLNELIIYSSKFSYFLLLCMVVPLFFEADNILHIWLVEVPEHSVNFVRLMLLITLFNPLENPIGISNDATGDIKKYQIVVSLINMQIITLSYISLYMGYPPESVFVVQILISIFQISAKFFLVRKKLHLSLKYYVYNVILRIVIVSLASVGLSFLLYRLFSDNIFSIFVFVALSALIVLFCSYFLGINKRESTIITQKVRAKIKRKINK